MKRKSIKNNVLAVIYTIIGFVGMMAAAGFGVYLYYSTILPVRIAGTYVIGNRILRYVLYAGCIVMLAGAAWLCDYGSTFLTKKLRYKVQRRKNYKKSKRR